MQARARTSPARWVSFSGIDGAGKSTQIEALCAAASQAGMRVRVIRFWDEVARLTGLRETSGHRIFKGDKGVGSPEKPLNRRDKNVRSWPMACLRLLLYTADAAATRAAVTRALRSGSNLVIFDRYIYDELANLNLRNPLMRVYVRAIMKLVPRPGASFILDADPVQARARKPEYPLEFIYINRRAYFDLSELIGGMTVIAPGTIGEVQEQVLRRALGNIEAGEGGSRRTGENFSVEPAALD